MSFLANNRYRYEERPFQVNGITIGMEQLYLNAVKEDRLAQVTEWSDLQLEQLKNKSSLIL